MKILDFYSKNINRKPEFLDCLSKFLGSEPKIFTDKAKHFYFSPKKINTEPKDLDKKFKNIIT